MIEVIHFSNRWGRKMVAVFGARDQTSSGPMFKDDPISNFVHSRYVERYAAGLEPAFYPVPAIPLQVKYDYVGCVNIDDVTDPDDPVIVYFYDGWANDGWSIKSSKCRSITC